MARAHLTPIERAEFDELLQRGVPKYLVNQEIIRRDLARLEKLNQLRKQKEYEATLKVPRGEVAQVDEYPQNTGLDCGSPEEWILRYVPEEFDQARIIWRLECEETIRVWERRFGCPLPRAAVKWIKGTPYTLPRDATGKEKAEFAEHIACGLPLNSVSRYYAGEINYPINSPYSSAEVVLSRTSQDKLPTAENKGEYYRKWLKRYRVRRTPMHGILEEEEPVAEPSRDIDDTDDTVQVVEIPQEKTKSKADKKKIRREKIKNVVQKFHEIRRKVWRVLRGKSCICQEFDF